MKQWHARTFFYVGTAIIAYFYGHDWGTRIVMWIILAVPIDLWNQRRLKIARHKPVEEKPE